METMFDVDKEMSWYKYDDTQKQELKGGVRYKRGKRVNKLTESGVYIKTYISIQAAANEMGVCAKYLRNVMRGKQRQSCGFKWEYAT